VSKKQWREVALADSCCGCGSVLTDLENDEAWDGDEARCDCCGRPGHVSSDEDGAHVNWHDEPTCQCWWCQTQDELTLLRAELAEARRRCGVVQKAAAYVVRELGGGDFDPNGIDALRAALAELDQDGGWS